MTKEEKIQHIKGRLKKAYSLPVSEQKKWQKKIAALEQELRELETDNYNKEVAFSMLTEAVLKLASELSWDKLNFEQLFTKHPELKRQLNETEKRLHTAYEIGGMTAFEKELNIYIGLFRKINAIINYNDDTLPLTQLNFEEINPLSDEYKQVVGEFGVWY